MFEVYLRLEERLKRQRLASIAVALAALQVVAAPFVLLSSEGSNVGDIAFALLVGAGMIYAGVRLRKRSELWSRVLTYLGSWPSIMLVGLIFWPLAMLIAIIWGICLFVSLVV